MTLDTNRDSTGLPKDEAPPEAIAADEPVRSIQQKWELNFSVVLAAISLILSLALASYNLVGWITGAQLEFIGPELVSFRCTNAPEVGGIGEDGLPIKQCTENSSVYLVAASNTYLNSGLPDYGAVVLSEEARVTFNGRSFRLNWHYFQPERVTASAFLVPGASAVAHETDFRPRDDACQNPCNTRAAFVPWKDFVAAMSDQARPIEIEIEFSTSVRLPKRDQLVHRCAVLVLDRDRQEFALRGMQKTNITSLTCRPTD